jgi:hypothetical protein
MHLPVINATIDPEVWKTSEGIGIGSTKADVLHAYHQPVFSNNLDDKRNSYEIAGIKETELGRPYVGDSSFLYSCLLSEKKACNDLRGARMGFGRGRLIWIAISDSE